MSAKAPGFLAASWIVARKDLAIELRTRSAFLSVVMFALLGLVIFFFAWDPTVVSPLDLAPGVLWVTFTFAGLLGLHRSFGVELQDRAIDALLAAPIEREAVYLGKAIANGVFVCAVLLIAVPARARRSSTGCSHSRRSPWRARSSALSSSRRWKRLRARRRRSTTSTCRRRSACTSRSPSRR